MCAKIAQAVLCHRVLDSRSSSTNSQEDHAVILKQQARSRGETNIRQYRPRWFTLRPKAVQATLSLLTPKKQKQHCLCGRPAPALNLAEMRTSNLKVKGGPFGWGADLQVPGAALAEDQSLVQPRTPQCA